MEKILDICFPIWANLHQSQLDFFKWQRAKAEIVKIVSYKEIPEISKEIHFYVKRRKVQIKDCYRTSQLILLDLQDGRLSSSEGYLIIQDFFPIAHGFNVFTHNGQKFYFDLTSEIALKQDLKEVNLMKVIDFDPIFIVKELYRTRFYGSMISNYYTYINGKRE